MLNQLLKFTLVSSALLWLRPRWRGLLALCVVVILVHVLHAEYLGYVELSDDRSFLVWSYVVKWLVLILSVSIYLVLSLSGPRGGRSRKAGTGGQGASTSAGPLAGGADDGFDFLRDKPRLESQADKLITGKTAQRDR